MASGSRNVARAALAFVAGAAPLAAQTSAPPSDDGILPYAIDLRSGTRVRIWTGQVRKLQLRLGGERPDYYEGKVVPSPPNVLAIEAREPLVLVLGVPLGRKVQTRQLFPVSGIRRLEQRRGRISGKRLLAGLVTRGLAGVGAGMAYCRHASCSSRPGGAAVGVPIGLATAAVIGLRPVRWWEPVPTRPISPETIPLIRRGAPAPVASIEATLPFRYPCVP